MTKKEIVIWSLQKKESPAIPYFLDMTDEIKEKMIAYTGDP